MNIRQQFESLLNPKRRMTAKITGGKGANVWVAETPTGSVVVLTGQGQIGQHVYYNAYVGGNQGVIQCRVGVSCFSSSNEAMMRLLTVAQ